jgi:hypothetical protein
MYYEKHKKVPKLVKETSERQLTIERQNKELQKTIQLNIEAKNKELTIDLDPNKRKLTDLNSMIIEKPYELENTPLLIEKVYHKTPYSEGAGLRLMNEEISKLGAYKNLINLGGALGLAGAVGLGGLFLINKINQQK